MFAPLKNSRQHHLNGQHSGRSHVCETYPSIDVCSSDATQSHQTVQPPTIPFGHSTSTVMRLHRFSHRRGYAATLSAVPTHRPASRLVRIVRNGMHPGFLPVDKTKTIVLILTLAQSDIWTFPFAQIGRTKRGLLPKDRCCEDHVDGWESQ